MAKNIILFRHTQYVLQCSGSIVAICLIKDVCKEKTIQKDQLFWTYMEFSVQNYLFISFYLYILLSYNGELWNTFKTKRLSLVVLLYGCSFSRQHIHIVRARHVFVDDRLRIGWWLVNRPIIAAMSWNLQCASESWGRLVADLSIERNFQIWRMAKGCCLISLRLSISLLYRLSSRSASHRCIR